MGGRLSPLTPGDRPRKFRVPVTLTASVDEEDGAAALLLTVHDELVLEAPAAEAEAVARLVEEEMTGVAKLAVPLVVDTGWGATWYDAKE